MPMPKILHDLIQPFRHNMDKANCDEYYCHVLGKLQPDSNDICSLSPVRSFDKNTEGSTQDQTPANLEVLFELYDEHSSTPPLLKVFARKSSDPSKSRIPIASHAIA